MNPAVGPEYIYDRKEKGKREKVEGEEEETGRRGRKKGNMKANGRWKG